MAYKMLGLADGTTVTAAHFAHFEKGLFDADAGIRRIESLDTGDDGELVSLRDLETGAYILYGYFTPFPDSHTTVIIDNKFMLVARLDAGSHLISISPLNAKIEFFEILVDDTKPAGHTFDKKVINILDIDKVKRTVYLTAPSAEYEQTPCQITSATGGMTLDEINALSTNGVTGWADAPVDVSAEAAFCYAATAYFENGVWGNFGQAVQIARYDAEK